MSHVEGRGWPGKSTCTSLGTPFASVGIVALPSVEYTPRDPGGSVLQQIVREHFETFRAEAAGFDVLACPRCGGRLRLVALLDESAVTRRILRHLGLPTEVPEARPARAPPLRDRAA